jgi:hypothetical protein
MPAVGAARDIYVNNAHGDDRDDGGTADPGSLVGGPVRSLGRALAIARAGDRVILTKTDEPYRECVTLQGGRHSGTPTRPFTIIGNGAVLDGRQPVPLTAWKPFAKDVYSFQPNRRSSGLLYIDNVPAVVPTERTPASLGPRESVLFRGEYYFGTEPGRLPVQYDLSVTFHRVGITLYEVRDVVIEDLVVQGYQLDGISAADSAFGVQLVGITSRGNGRAGVHVGGASRVRLEACLLGNNGTAQLRTEGWCHVQLAGSDLIEGGAPAVKREGGKVETMAGPAAN